MEWNFLKILLLPPLKRFYGFSSLVCLYDELFWSIFECWTRISIFRIHPFGSNISPFFIYCYIIYYILLINFASCSWGILVYSFFPCSVFVCFWYWHNAGFTERDGKYSILLYFLEDIVCHCYYFFLKCLEEFTIEIIIPGFFKMPG